MPLTTPAQPSLPPTSMQRFMANIVASQKLILLAVGVAGGAYYYSQPLPEPVEAAAELLLAAKEKQQLMVERDRLTNRIVWLREDRAFLEIAARDYLNRQQPGEKILHFQR
jgi:hypothetical protein